MFVQTEELSDGGTLQTDTLLTGLPGGAVADQVQQELDSHDKPVEGTASELYVFLEEPEEGSDPNLADVRHTFYILSLSQSVMYCHKTMCIEYMIQLGIPLILCSKVNEHLNFSTMKVMYQVEEEITLKYFLICISSHCID